MNTIMEFLIGIVYVIFLAFWIWGLVDCIRRKDYPKKIEGFLWGLFMLSFFPSVIIYYVCKRKKWFLFKNKQFKLMKKRDRVGFGTPQWQGEKVMKNIENVKEYREDICDALGVEFKEEYMNDDYFLGNFSGQQKDYLDSLGLINRDFCPLCGKESISNEYHRSLAYSRAVQYLCKDCWERTNPHLTIPGYTRRVYAYNFVMLVIGVSVLIGVSLLARGCFRFLFYR